MVVVDNGSNYDNGHLTSATDSPSHSIDCFADMFGAKRSSSDTYCSRLNRAWNRMSSTAQLSSTAKQLDTDPFNPVTYPNVERAMEDIVKFIHIESPDCWFREPGLVSSRNIEQICRSVSFYSLLQTLEGAGCHNKNHRETLVEHLVYCMTWNLWLMRHGTRMELLSYGLMGLLHDIGKKASHTVARHNNETYPTYPYHGEISATVSYAYYTDRHAEVVPRAVFEEVCQAIRVHMCGYHCTGGVSGASNGEADKGGSEAGTDKGTAESYSIGQSSSAPASPPKNEDYGPGPIPSRGKISQSNTTELMENDYLLKWNALRHEQLGDRLSVLSVADVYAREAELSHDFTSFFASRQTFCDFLNAPIDIESLRKCVPYWPKYGQLARRTLGRGLMILVRSVCDTEKKEVIDRVCDYLRAGRHQFELITRDAAVDQFAIKKRNAKSNGLGGGVATTSNYSIYAPDTATRKANAKIVTADMKRAVAAALKKGKVVVFEDPVLMYLSCATENFPDSVATTFKIAIDVRSVKQTQYNAKFGDLQKQLNCMNAQSWDLLPPNTKLILNAMRSCMSARTCHTGLMNLSCAHLVYPVVYNNSFDAMGLESALRGIELGLRVGECNNGSRSCERW